MTEINTELADALWVMVNNYLDHEGDMGDDNPEPVKRACVALARAGRPVLPVDGFPASSGRP